ncbi:MAG: hypothetical protein ACKVQW_16535 [Pyrinomonadaceae bacterium]
MPDHKKTELGKGSYDQLLHCLSSDRLEAESRYLDLLRKIDHWLNYRGCSYEESAGVAEKVIDSLVAASAEKCPDHIFGLAKDITKKRWIDHIRHIKNNPATINADGDDADNHFDNMADFRMTPGDFDETEDPFDTVLIAGVRYDTYDADMRECIRYCLGAARPDKRDLFFRYNEAPPGRGLKDVRSEMVDEMAFEDSGLSWSDRDGLITAFDSGTLGDSEWNDRIRALRKSSSNKLRQRINDFKKEIEKCARQRYAMKKITKPR